MSGEHRTRFPFDFLKNNPWGTNPLIGPFRGNPTLVRSTFFPVTSQTVTPSLFTNTNSFPAEQLNLQLTAPLLTNTASFPASQLNLRLTGPLLTNSQTFFAPTVIGSQTVTPSLFTNTNTLYGPQVNLSLTAPLITNTNSFFAPQVNLRISPALLTNTQTFYGPQLNLQLTVGLFTNTNTFFAPAVLGTQTVVAPLLTDGDTFYAPQLNLQLTAPLLSNTNTFYAPSVTQTQVITAALLTNSQTFYGPQLNLGLTAPLLTNSQSFFAEQLNLQLSIGLLSNSNTFFDPTVVFPQTITPSLFTNTNTFYGPTTAQVVNLTLASGQHRTRFPFDFLKPNAWDINPLIGSFGGTPSIARSMFFPDTFTGNTNTFFESTITQEEPVGGTQTVTGPLFDNSATFYPPQVNMRLYPARASNTNTFPAATVLSGSITIVVPLVTNDDQEFFSPNVARVQYITPSLFTNTNTFFGPTLNSTLIIRPPLIGGGSSNLRRFQRRNPFISFGLY